MNRHDEKEKLMNEVLGKSRPFNNDYQEAINSINSIEDELDKLIANNRKELDNMSKSLNTSATDLQAELQKDYGENIKAPETIVVGKASKEVFDKINAEIKTKVIGQDEAIDNMCIAFRRPYITGSNPNLIRNSIILNGKNGTGRHLLVNATAQALKNNGLNISSEVITMDMSRYQFSTQEALFLQDLYVALNGSNPIIVVENFAEANPIFNRMLAELVENGTCVLNKRYTFKQNQLQETNNSLNTEVIDHLSGNNKILVFISELKASKLMDIFGKSFVEKIQDRISTAVLDEESLVKIIDQLLNDFEKKSETQLEIDVILDASIKDYLKSIYQPEDGMDSLSPKIDKIYDELVNIALKKDELNNLTLKYDGSLKAVISDEEIDLSIGDNSDKERQEIQKELDSIVGLDTVKEYLLSLENHIKISQLRKQKGLKTAEVSKHMIFTGNPGTGKTTIARIVSRMMKACGILKQGQLVEVTRADLVGKYVGHTAPLTMEVINSALGGVLFIDEAYSLYRGKDDSFGLEAIDTIVKAMEDHRDDLIVILAGYSKEMEQFLSANSGLKSRFANIIHFDDYTGEQMCKIAEIQAKNKDYEIDEEALKALKDYFTIVQSKNDANSGNGRLARNVVEAAILKQAKRILEDPDADMNKLIVQDFNLE